jgi:hypothetical protein
MHERLSIPGFLRGSRWIARSGTPRYLILYEVAGVEVATSPAYLARLNDPTPWTSATMPRITGMIRGFCTVAASAGYGLGTTAFSMRFRPNGDASDVRKALPEMQSRPGMASVHLLQPVARPPMTKEQSLRGRDAETGWILLATAHDPGALAEAADHFFGAIADAARGTYALGFTATAAEVARSPANPPRRP